MSQKRITYRGYEITFDPQSHLRPERSWLFAHYSYDGEPDAWGRAASVEEAKRAIDDLKVIDGDPLPAPEQPTCS